MPKQEKNKMNKIRLKITTPLGTFFDDDIEIVTLKTPEGYIGLQHNRVPFISSIEISTMYVNIDKNNKKIAAIGGGLVFVEKQHIDIFTDDIEWKEEINKSEIKKLFDETTKKLQSNFKDNVEKHKYEILLKKTINKLSTLEKK